MSSAQFFQCGDFSGKQALWLGRRDKQSRHLSATLSWQKILCHQCIYSKGRFFSRGVSAPSFTPQTALCLISVSLCVPRMLKNLTCLPHSSMRTLMRSTVLIFYENTTLLLLHFLNLGSREPRAVQFNFCLLDFSSLSLSRGNSINSLLWCLSCVVPALV